MTIKQKVIELYTAGEPPERSFPSLTLHDVQAQGPGPEIGGLGSPSGNPLIMDGLTQLEYTERHLYRTKARAHGKHSRNPDLSARKQTEEPFFV